MSYLIVSPLSQIDHVAQSHGPSHMLTLINGTMRVDRPSIIEKERHLRLNFNDIEEPQDGLVIAEDIHMERMLEFIRAWPQEGPLLVHCWAGVSRSTAGALISLMALRPTLDPFDAAERLRQASPTASPNRRLITLADRALGHGGALIKAADMIGRGAEVKFEAKPFVLSLD